jgi:hypothetical protein
MGEWRIGVIGTAALLIGCLIILGASGSNDPVEKALANTAISKISYQPGWDRVEADLVQSNNYSLKLFYRPPGPDNIVMVIQDTREIARAMLGELVASGHSPSRDHTFLWVWAQVPVDRGETGEQLVRVYGHTEYNSGSDQLEFKPWKP